eukprot:TRINITY_DN4238_c0_g1_i1.p1 TRINITY_DN4238_c0_g1~~TRINITY_DN4238_c0_g1_i1.p1  ORF type:complete len:277 (-),score=93.55 TRINITY_DN4238_c0_g1_i1:349-1179(-)
MNFEEGVMVFVTVGVLGFCGYKIVQQMLNPPSNEQRQHRRRRRHGQTSRNIAHVGAPTSEWHCPRCTFLNGANHATCSMCGCDSNGNVDHSDGGSSGHIDNTNESIMEEQDLAYQRAIEADQKRKDDAIRREAEKAEAEEAQEIQNALKLSLQYAREEEIENIRRSLPSEPAVDSNESAHVVFRLNNKRFSRRFNYNDTLKNLLDYVNVSEELDMIHENENTNEETSEWEVIESFPPRRNLSKLDDESKASTLEDLGLHHGGILLVCRKDPDDVEE